MQRQRLSVPVIAFILLVILCLSVVGCGQAIPSEEELKAAYVEAVKDAQIAGPEEICRDLEPIVYYNPDLIWEGEPGESRVLLLTWTSWDGYSDSAGGNTTLSREVWVVVPDELKDFYLKNDSLSGDDLILRLEQLYGLPPHNGKKWFVEMWVQPADLFRPSPDPDIADCEAELDFPGWVDNGYREWFDTLKSASYGDNGYPWTRLGYTYDWGNENGEIGLSEFVVRAGSTVGIHGAIGNLDYLKN